MRTFLQKCCGWENSDEDTDSPESHNGESGSSICDIERAERAKRAALICSAESLCASQKAHTHAALQRLGVSMQQATLPSPQPPASPKRRPESSFPRRLRPISVDQMLDREDPIVKDRSPSPDSLSSVDTHTPTELRDIPYLGHFTPTLPPTAAPRRTSRLPVMRVRVGGAVKQVADGYKLQTAKTTMEELTRSLQKFQVIHQPKPPAAPRRTPAMVPKVPAPPSTSAPPKTKGPRRGTKLCPAKPVSKQEYLQPLSKPTESLSLCFEQLTSDDWEKKLDGCKSIRALAQHHPEILLTKLRQLCLLLTEVVNSPRSAVACAGIDTVAALHLHLGRAMDLEAETTGRTLLLQLAQKSSAFIHQQVNLALDAVVEGCSPKRVLSALVNTGLSHRCAAVRGSTAQHLHQLADIIGEDSILTSGQAFAESFLTAVSKMALDAAPEARHHGKQMLQGLAQQKEFSDLCDRILPVKDRRPLQKILRMMQ
ncbi:hypothetical protein ABVT39_011275 [Epinephelus coioides]